MRTTHFWVITQRVVVITTCCVIAEKSTFLKMEYCSFLSANFVSFYWICTQRNTVSSYQYDKANFIVPEKVCCTRKGINVIPIHRHCLVHFISPVTSYPQFLPTTHLQIPATVSGTHPTWYQCLLSWWTVLFGLRRKSALPLPKLP